MISWGSFLLGGMIFGFLGFLLGVVFGGFHEKVRMYEEMMEQDGMEVDDEIWNLTDENDDIPNPYSEIDPDQNWRCQ